MVQRFDAPPFPEQTEQEFRLRHAPVMGAFNSISNDVCDALARAQESDARHASHLIEKFGPKREEIVKHLTQAAQDRACAYAYTTLNPTTASLQSLAALSERLEKAKTVCLLPPPFWLVVKVAFEVANLPASWLEGELGALPDLRALERMCDAMRAGQTRHDAALLDVAGERASSAGHARDLDGLLDIACRDYDHTWLLDVADHIGAAAGESFAALLDRLAAICDDGPFLVYHPHEHTPPFCQAVQPRCYSALWAYAEYDAALALADRTKRAWHAKLGSGRSAFDDLDEDALQILAAFLVPAAAARLRVACRWLSECAPLAQRAPSLHAEVQTSSPEKKSSETAPIQFLRPTAESGGYRIVNSTVDLRIYVCLKSTATLLLDFPSSAAARSGAKPHQELWLGLYPNEAALSAAAPAADDGPTPTPQDVARFFELPCNQAATWTPASFDDTVQQEAALPPPRRHTGQVQPSALAAERARFTAELVPLGHVDEPVDPSDPAAAAAAVPLHLRVPTGSNGTKRRGPVPQPRLYNLPSDQAAAAMVVVNLSTGAVDEHGTSRNFTSLLEHNEGGGPGRSVYCVRVTAHDAADSSLTMGSAVTPPFVVSGRSKNHARAPKGPRRA